MIRIFLSSLSPSPPPRQLRQFFRDELIRDLMKSTDVQKKLEDEFKQLKEDRQVLRTIFPTGNSKVNIMISPSLSLSISNHLIIIFSLIIRLLFQSISAG